MSTDAVLSLVLTSTKFALGIFVLSANPKGYANRLWFVFMMCLVLWGAGDAAVPLSTSQKSALFFHNIGGVGFCFFPSVFLSFCFAVGNTANALRSTWFTLLLHGVSLCMTVFFVAGFMSPEAYSPEGFTTVMTGGHLVFLVWLLLCTVWGIGVCATRLRDEAAPRERRRILMLVLGLSVALLVGVLGDVLPLPPGVHTIHTTMLATASVAAVGSFVVVTMQFDVPPSRAIAASVFEHSGDLVCVVRTDGAVTFANDLFRAEVGDERSLKIHLRDVILEAEGVLEVMGRVEIKERKTRVMEVSYRTKAGTTPVLLSMSRMENEGEREAWVLVGRDIADHAELVRKVEQSQEKYRHIVESSLDGIIVVQDDLLVYINPSAAKIFEYQDAGEMKTIKFDQLVAPGSRPFVFGDPGRAPVGTDILRSYEMKGLTKSGKVIDVEINAKLISWVGATAIQASFRDITKRKALEKEQAVWFWEQESLMTIDRQLASMVDLEKVLGAVSHHAQVFTRADFSGLAMIRAQSRSYSWRAMRGNLQMHPTDPTPLKEVHQVFLRPGGPIIVRDFGKDPSMPVDDFPVLRAERIVSFAGFPLRVADDLQGVLIVGFRKGHTFSDRELRLLTSLAEKSSIALANAELYGNLRQRERELERLADARIQAQEEERRRIAREIHDGLGQILTAIKFNVEILEDTIPLGEENRKKVAEIKVLLDNVMTEAREISYNLLPSVLDDFGLAPALQLLCEQCGKRLGIPVRFHANGVANRMPDSLEINLYRIAQEALNNISKYAEARVVDVQLIGNEEGIRMTVEDDGKGFSAGERFARADGKGGMGLVSMRERVSSFGGALTVDSHPGSGTTVMVEIPLSRQRNGTN